MDGSQEVTVRRDGEWFVISDEGGEFARASTVEGAVPYVRDLLYGPSTYGPNVTSIPGRTSQTARDALLDEAARRNAR